MIVQEMLQEPSVSLHTIEGFLTSEQEKGVSAEQIRRFSCILDRLYAYLSEHPGLTRENLLAWRTGMQKAGYSSATIGNHVKCVNRFLTYLGMEELRFPKGRAKEISGMQFGRLIALKPTGEIHRGEHIWLFRCQCGNQVKLPATRVIQGNTLSCGCLKANHLNLVKKYYQGTSLAQSMDENVRNENSASGYVGVAPKRDKWQAYIQYKGVRYHLGCYGSLEEAVKARARAKELVIEDAQELLKSYITEKQKQSAGG